MKFLILFTSIIINDIIINNIKIERWVLIMGEDFTKKINSILLKYENNGEKEILEYINDMISSKNGKWDLGINLGSQGLTKMLLYEYATAIENLSNGKLKSEFVIDKLANKMGTLRYGYFKKGQDDNIKYGENPVTSSEYTTQCRVEDKFGAHSVSYEENDGMQQDAVVLFDDKQTLEDGSKLSGIDLSNLSDIRHTVFHEFTHVMEKCLVERKDLKEEITFKQGNSTYINSLLSADLTIEEYQSYIDNISLDDGPILFGGISTIEINLEKNPNKRIMHNQISEGSTEYISRLIMKEVGDTVEHPERYSKQVEIAEKMFTSRGLEDSLKDYFTCPNKIISELESCSIDGKDLLHYMSDYINLKPNLDEFLKSKIDEKNVNQMKFKVMELLQKNPTEELKVEFINDIIKDIKTISVDFDEKDEKNTESMLNMAIDYKEIESNIFETLDEKMVDVYNQRIRKEDLKDQIKADGNQEQRKSSFIEELKGKVNQIPKTTFSEKEKYNRELEHEVEKTDDDLVN